MPPPKRKASAAWEEECAALIDSGDADAVRAIAAKLETLQRSVEPRLFDLKPPTTVCRVLLIKSNQEPWDEEYERYNMHVSAEFTAGPQAATFSISFYFKDVEGKLIIEVESDLFTYNGYHYNGNGDHSIPEFDDDDIESFLRDAGLSEALPQRARRLRHEDDNMPDYTRRSWVFGDVIYDAVGLVKKKHGLLGMDKDTIYSWLFPYYYSSHGY